MAFDSHNGRVFKSAVMLACALVVLAGCRTAPRRLVKSNITPKVWESSTTNQPVPLTLVTNAPAPLTNAPAPPPPVTNPPAISFSRDGWIPINRWTEVRGFEKARRTATAPVESFAVVTPAGILRFSLGSLLASWDGVEIRLGFAPHRLEGQVFLHSLDIKKTLEPLLKSRPPLKTSGKVIVLDAGHGGSSPGTRSATDVRSEKYFTLDWALRAAELLRTNGWQVILTRTNDVDVSLADRIALAEERHADLFISLHFNSSGGGGNEQSGLETYCLTPQGMTSTLTRGYEDDPKEWSPNNAFDEENFLLALQLHRALLRVNGHADRGVRRARFLTVLRGHNRPAALIEGGYLSNPAEARRIAQPEYRQKLAEAVAEALK